MKIWVIFSVFHISVLAESFFLTRSPLCSGLFFFLELIYEDLMANNIQSLFFNCILKTILLNLMDFQYFWNCFIVEIFEIDIIITYKCSVYMIETKFQMYFQKIYSFIKFRSLYTEFFSIQKLKNIKLFGNADVFALKKTIPTYRRSLFRCFVSYFI